MRHRKAGRSLRRTSEQRLALLRNLATSTNTPNISGNPLITWVLNKSASTFRYTAPNGTTDSVATGKMDVANNAVTAFMVNAVSDGVNMKWVAGQAGYTPKHGTLGLVVRKELYDSGEVRSMKDLKGKTIGVFNSGIQAARAESGGGGSHRAAPAAWAARTWRKAAAGEASLRIPASSWVGPSSNTSVRSPAKTWP